MRNHGSRRSTCLVCLVLGATSIATGTSSVAYAQQRSVADSVSALVSAGDRASDGHDLAQALARYEAAVALDARSVPAHLRAARVAVDLGEAERDAGKRAEYFERAARHAQRAVELSPNDADAHFHVARATGRTALDAGPRERVKFAKDVRAHALRALELEPRHPGALHVLGVWNAEVMRLNGFQRTFARAFLGGQVLASASWADAARYLEQAVSVEPERAVHHLDLARVYRDMGRVNDARAAYRAVMAAPTVDPNDALYKRQAAQELAALR